MIDDAQLHSLVDWLWSAGAARVVEEMVAPSHPARVWLGRDAAPRAAFADLIRVLANGGHLPLLVAIALRTRSRGGSTLPANVEETLAHALEWWDGEMRRPAGAEAADLFVCYAHEDGERLTRLLDVLRRAGLSVYRDVDRIPPGVSIATSVAAAIAECRAALAIVSRMSVASSWVGHELALLMPGSASGARPVYPIVIDDVPLPPAIADLFAIDLRGLSAATSTELIERRLQPLVDELQRGRNDRGVLLQS